MIFIDLAEDRRKYNGGNKNAGRKPKAQEQHLIEKLTPLEPLAFAALKDGLDKKQNWAVKIFMDYRFGKPKETKDIKLDATTEINFLE